MWVGAGRGAGVGSDILRLPRTLTYLQNQSWGRKMCEHAFQTKALMFTGSEDSNHGTLILVPLTIVHFFISVAYVWVRGAKTTGPIAKKFVFS
jgi:hypothetical protein